MLRLTHFRRASGSGLVKKMLLVTLAMLPLASVGCLRARSLTAYLNRASSIVIAGAGSTQAYINHNVNGDIRRRSYQTGQRIDAAWRPGGDGPLGYTPSNAHSDCSGHGSRHMSRLNVSRLRTSVKMVRPWPSGSSQDVLEYSGIAFVSIDEDEGRLKVKTPSINRPPITAT